MMTVWYSEKYDTLMLWKHEKDSANRDQWSHVAFVYFDEGEETDIQWEINSFGPASHGLVLVGGFE